MINYWYVIFCFIIVQPQMRTEPAVADVIGSVGDGEVIRQLNNEKLVRVLSQFIQIYFDKFCFSCNN